jgi:adenine-specific DNA methylase
VTSDALAAAGLLMPQNGKFFKRFTVSDMRRLQQAEAVWLKYGDMLPYPKSSIPPGAETSRLLEHHYQKWADMFAPRQLLALSTLLQGIMVEENQKLREFLLAAFSSCLDLNNLFTRYMASRESAGGQTAQGVFARHDYQLKVTITENNVFGLPEIGMGSFLSKYALLLDGLEYKKACWDFVDHDDGEKRKKTIVDSLFAASANISCGDVGEPLPSGMAHIITDPPYVGNVNYAELADFYYVWLRLALRENYPHFAPEFTP